MDLGLKDKLAFVSGSTAGIGFAIATALAGEGARVVVNGRTQPAVDAAIAEIRSRTGADAHGFAGDLSLASTAAALFRAHPDVEILVNNFGIFEPKSFEDIADAEWVRFFEANVLSGVRLARLYLPSMRRANWGRIIFISSESAVQIPAEMIHYGMTKTAQLAVSRGRGSPSTACSPARQNRAASTNSSRRSPEPKASRSMRSRRSSSKRCARPRSSSDSPRQPRSRAWWSISRARQLPRPPAPPCASTAG
jgi:hypothetical protein